jgi:hypothetical protein
MPYKELCGAIHMHTTFSDGSMNVAECIETAQAIGLDYIVITDHMTLDARQGSFENTHGNLMVIVGYEHNDSINTNHYLALGVSNVCDKDLPPQGYIDCVKKQGGFGFLAHPMERRHYFPQYPPYPWTAWDAKGFDGIELWNQLSEWVENLRSWRSHIRILYPRRFLNRIQPELLEKWDTLNKERFVSGIGGVDSHSLRVGKGFLRFIIFPIKVELKGIRTHLYVASDFSKSDFRVAQPIVHDSIRNGHGFISNFRQGDARGSCIFFRKPDGTLIPPGLIEDSVEPKGSFWVTVPQQCRIVLIKNGKSVAESFGREAHFSIQEKGLYRIEVYRKHKAWIYSNPFPLGSYPF